MGQISTSEFKSGVKLEIEGQPYVVVNNEFVKPGKGQAINRVRIKNLLNGRVIEKTFRSGDKVEEADIIETTMRMLYRDGEEVVFMDDNNYDQVSVSKEAIGDSNNWLKEDLLYYIVFYKGNAINVEPPTFLELKVAETSPGVRGDTASGRVMKPAKLETGVTIQVPIFIEEEEMLKIDTRNGEYVSRA